MSKVSYYPCMVLDAICYLGQRSEIENMKYMLKDEISFYEKINQLTEGRLFGDFLGMSTLSLIISTYTENKGLEKYTLSDLIGIFEKCEDLNSVVRQRITNPFTMSYVFPMLEWLMEGYAAKYISYLKVLEEIGFEDAWTKEVLPLELEQIKAKENSIIDFDFDLLMDNISKMKSVRKYGEIKIFVSLLSHPTAFTLYGGCFLDCFNSGNVMSMLAHELMHGFASDELINEYLKYVESDAFLKICHDTLISEFGSGNEEEMVMAAEYYLLYQQKGHSKDDLLKEGINRYNGCVPFSIILFDMLTKEKEVPTDYNQWLINKFKTGAFPKSDIKEYVSSLLLICTDNL